MTIKIARKSGLIETFGEGPLMKVLDFFLMYPEFDYSKSQVAREAGISRITIEKIWSKLKKSWFIVKTRNVGRADMYKLNTGDPRVKVLMKFDFELSSAYLENKGAKAVGVSSAK